MDLTVGFVLRNLVAMVNLVEFRYSQNFTFFKASGVGGHMENNVSACMECASKYK